ncbi:MAG: hypothetical protein ACJ8DQ_10325 [Xanthobacteraceae bacterium]
MTTGECCGQFTLLWPEPEAGHERVIIEWHTHVYPPEEAAGDAGTYDGRSGPTWAGRCPMTVENVLDAHHKAGLDISVVSNAAHYLRGKPGFQL